MLERSMLDLSWIFLDYGLYVLSFGEILVIRLVLVVILSLLILHIVASSAFAALPVFSFDDLA
jgi:hypothetical protein